MIEHAARPRIDRPLKLQFTPAVELTIAAGVVTATQSAHRIDTEADAAADELTTINGGVAGDLLLLYAENAARVVTLKHGAANLRTPTGADHVLSRNGFCMLYFDGNNWLLQQ